MPINNAGSLAAPKDGEVVMTASVTSNGVTQTATIHIEVSTFPLSLINPNFWGSNGTYNEKTQELQTDIYGFGGWNYEQGIDLSQYDKLIIDLKEGPTCAPNFRLYDENGYFAAHYELGMSANEKLYTIDLQSGLTKDNGQTLSAPATSVLNGIYDVYLVFHGIDGQQLHLDYWSLTAL